MPDYLRRVAVLTVIGALGIGILLPLTARSATPQTVATQRLLEAAEGVAADPLAAATDRSASALRGSSASLALALLTAPIGPELLEATDALREPPTIELQPTFQSKPQLIVAAPAINGDEITGRATWYCCTLGWTGQAVIALPGALGGHYDPPPASRYVTVCGDRCVRLPVVDYCGCLWGTASQKIADLSPEAWALVSDAALSRGVITVTVHLDG